jgi:hypothetical protein
MDQHQQQQQQHPLQQINTTASSTAKPLPFQTTMFSPQMGAANANANGTFPPQHFMLKTEPNAGDELMKEEQQQQQRGQQQQLMFQPSTAFLQHHHQNENQNKHSALGIDINGKQKSHDKNCAFTRESKESNFLYFTFIL